MGTFTALVFLCLSLTSLTSAGFIPIEDFNTLRGRSTGLDKQCGGNIGTSEGIIVYTTTLSNVRCVWFIQAPNATTYNVQTSFPPNVTTNNLILTTFNYNVSESHYYPSEGQNLTLYDVGVLMVTFYTSKTSEFRGFGLYFTSSYGKGNPAPLLWPHHTLENGTSINYPVDFERSVYSKLELTCFLFAPKNGIYSPKLQTKVCYTGDLIQGCNDHVTIYKFGYYSNWERVTRVCGHVSTAEKFQNNDLILAVFESDRLYETSGFQLKYNKNCK